MSISAPMKVMTCRMNSEDKRHLEQLARERDVTLSHALREGARLYLEDAKRWKAGCDATTTT
jgi:predicted transcriptional regulator